MIKTGAIILLLLGDLNFTGLNFMAEFSKNGYNPEFPFNAAASVIQKADIAIANLEGPLTFADWSPESEKRVGDSGNSRSLRRQLETQELRFCF